MAGRGHPQLPPNKGDRPKRHHVVARFYLERFSVNGKVELVDRHDFTKSLPPTAVEKVLAENHFYSITTKLGREPLGEIFLREHVDTPGCDAIRRMFDEERPLAAPAARNAISRFVAYQQIRGRCTKDALAEYDKACLRVADSITTTTELLKAARARGEEMTEEEATETVAVARARLLELELPRPGNIHVKSTFPTASEMVPFFRARTWQVLTFDEPCLITSDEPVALIRDDDAPPGDGGGILGAQRIVFPIDPRRALVMFRRDLSKIEGRLRGRPEDARTINRHVAFSAHRYVVRTPGTNPLAGITLPPKAPPVFVIDNKICYSPQVSVQAQAKMIAELRRNVARAPG